MGEKTQTYLDNTGQNHYNYFAKMVFVCAPRNFAGAKERNDLNMANMKKEYKMSAERKEELQKELTYLKTVREKEVADLIKEARGFGDLSENSEYDEAKNEQGKLYSRIAEVEEILLHTVIVDENDAGTNGISIGCRVTVQDVKSGRELPEYKVVGSQEATPCTAPSPRIPPSARRSWAQKRATRSRWRPLSAPSSTALSRSNVKLYYIE